MENNEYEQAREQALYFFTSEARQRFANIELAHPRLAYQIIASVIQGIKSNLIKVVDDNLLKMMIAKLNDKKEYRIIRK